MAIKVIIPKVDMDQETGTIVEWLKTDGNQVKQGEVILVIETEKVTFDVEATASGELQGVRFKPGDRLPIGTVIAYILAPGEELPDEEVIFREELLDQDMTPVEEIQSLAIIPSRVRATPLAQKMAADKGLDLAGVIGTGAGGKITRRDVEGVIKGVGDIGKIYATPKARRLARRDRVELSLLSGTGPAGRIQADDVLAASSGLPSRFESSGSTQDKVIPLRGMRRTIAERISTSYQSIPHITFSTTIDMTNFEQVRAQLSAEEGDGKGKQITVTGLLVRLVALTLQRHPWLNSKFDTEQIVLHGSINIGIAVALEDGLIVPVIKDADKKNVHQIADQVEDLVQRAHAGQLNLDDVKGGTFTISNLGPFGIESFTAIINPGQAAILAVGSAQPEIVAVGDQVEIRKVMHLTLSVDHRIVDGAVAAQFMTKLKEILENPSLDV